MKSAILVTGGTGTLGRQVVAQLRRGRDPIRVLSRRAHEPEPGIEFVTGDLATGLGVDAAVEGVETIVHCAGSAKGDGDKARHLVRAAERAGSKHLVFISVVGADRVPMEGALDRMMFGYFGSKLSAERVVMESSLGWTILRATQFYDLLLIVAQLMTRLPLVPIPAGFQFQPIDSGEVAARMVELALGPPAGLVPDFAGPRTYDAAELLRSYLRLADKRRLLLRLWLPGKAARAVREGAILSPDHAVGRRTWEDFLADRVGSPQVSNARNR